MWVNTLNKNKKILLIAFKYPPYAGVGGFRWSKLSKYLAEMGYSIHVVTVNWKQYGDNTNIDDVQHPNITIHRINSIYPHNFKYMQFKNTKIGNIERIIRHLFFRLGNVIWYEDEAQYWGYSLLPFCEQLIKNDGIKNVIATGHPFMANYWAAKLKQKHPEINLIQDLRDPWTENPFKSYLLGIYKKKSVKHEIFALNNCDVLLAVTNGLVELFSEKIYNNVITKSIPNGFDIDFNNKNAVSRDFTLIYAGALFNGRDEPFEAFLKAIQNIEEKIPEIKICIYGSFPNSIRDKYKQMFVSGKIKSYPSVSPEKIHKLMHHSFACLHFNARLFPFAVSTKIYEHAALKRPTFSVNYGGDTENLMRNHNFGISVNGDDIGQIEDGIVRLYELWKSNPNYEISPFNLEMFDYKNLAEEVTNYFV